MNAARSKHRWMYSALALGTGLLFAVTAGFALTWFALLPSARLLPVWGVLLAWFAGAATCSALLWLLVDRCVRVGGARSLALGLAVPLLVQLAVGKGGLAGVGLIAALVVDAFLVVALVMGVVAIRRAARAASLTAARQA